MTKTKLANRKSRTELRTQMDFKGITVETRVKLKLMAANRGIHLYQLLDQLVEEAFEKEQNQIAGPGVAARIRKEIRRILIAAVRAPGKRL